MPKQRLFLKQIFKKYPVLFAYVFGSYTREKIGALSDIDIAVYFDREINKEKRFKLRYDIQDEIEVNFKAQGKIDVISLNDADPFLEKEVVYNGKVLYVKDNDIRKHYEANAIGRWLDWKWYDEQFIQSIKKKFGKPIKSYSY